MAEMRADLGTAASDISTLQTFDGPAPETINGGCHTLPPCSLCLLDRSQANCSCSVQNMLTTCTHMLLHGVQGWRCKQCMCTAPAPAVGFHGWCWQSGAVRP
eukprot:GHRQ01026218.1.p2 GENE.GHRQ01026218.1~~GHRQ01026218.1.p2  ORF type:complete len:102 (+),score=8.31 GHRQ01026218.1:399-704(+)